MWLKESNYNLKLLNQVLLFLNLYTSIAWVMSCSFVLYYHSSELSSLSFPLICFCIGSPIEFIRIYLGYSGNIRNDVSIKVVAAGFITSPKLSQVLNLAGLLILSTFIELPIHIYLLLSLYETIYHLTFIIQMIQLALLPIEILLNFIIIRASLHERNLQFQMMFSNDNKLN
jgi:hypothetical protein